jgi:hypothetical protein
VWFFFFLFKGGSFGFGFGFDNLLILFAVLVVTGVV